MSEGDDPIRPMTVGGNRLTLLPDGPERLEALIALIDGARESLRVLYYIWADDAAGRRVRDALIAAARRGVRVSLLVDGFGASDQPAGFFQPLIDAEARFCRFVPRWGRRYLLRNHQKLALADGDKAIVGGFNISDDYFGTIEAGAWRDLGLQVEGPGVHCLVGYFESVFAWAEMPNASIRRLRRALFQNSVRDGADPLAVRRADAAAQPVGALGQERPDAGALGRHHLGLFRAEPVDAAPAVPGRRARPGADRDSGEARPSMGGRARRASSTGGC